MGGFKKFNYATDFKLNIGSIRAQMLGVKGADETIAAFAALPKRAQVNLYRRAIRPGLSAIAKEAKALAMNIPTRGGLEPGEKAKSGGGSTRKEIAKAITVRISAKGKKGVYGSTSVRYKKRGNTNKVPAGNKASLAHLLEFGWTLKTAWGARMRKVPIEIDGTEFMTSAFKRLKGRAERMMQTAMTELVKNPGVDRGSFGAMMEGVS